MFGFAPAFSFHCGFSGADRLEVGCHKEDSRPDVASLLPVRSAASPLGVHQKGPKLGPTFAGSFVTFCGAFSARGRQNVVARFHFRGMLGDVDGHDACSPRANKAMAVPRGVGNG